MDEFLAVEPDYPLHYFLANSIGANFDLCVTGPWHDTYASILNVDEAHRNRVRRGRHGGGWIPVGRRAALPRSLRTCRCRQTTPRRTRTGMEQPWPASFTRWLRMRM